MMGLCLVTLGIYFSLKEGGSDVTNLSVLPLGSVVLFIICFSLGFGPIPWMMVRMKDSMFYFQLTKLFHRWVNFLLPMSRELLQPSLSCSTGLWSSLLQKLLAWWKLHGEPVSWTWNIVNFPFLMHFSTGPTFYFFASFMVVGTIFVFMKVPETKGKSNAQIQAILAGKN